MLLGHAGANSQSNSMLWFAECFVHISCLIISALVVSSEPLSQWEPTGIVFQSPALEKKNVLNYLWQMGLGRGYFVS